MVHVDEPDPAVGILELMVLAVGREIGIRSLCDSCLGKLGAGSATDSDTLYGRLCSLAIANPRGIHAFPDLAEQVLCRDSEEALGQPCLGVFDAHVRRFVPGPDLKIPHMGWNTLGNLESKLLRDLPPQPWVYFVHSYYAATGPDTIATTRYGDILLSAALKYEQFYGTQFHPEKSGDTGERILQNFLAL